MQDVAFLPLAASTADHPARDAADAFFLDDSDGTAEIVARAPPIQEDEVDRRVATEESGAGSMTLRLALSMLTEAETQWKLSEWQLRTTHPFLVCKCAGATPMTRCEGARGRFWGCTNYRANCCGFILNDAPARKRLTDMLRVVEEMYDLRSNGEYMQLVAAKRKHAPGYRALFSPVRVLLRDAVGNTRINHVAPFSAQATSAPLQNLHFYDRHLVKKAGAAVAVTRGEHDDWAEQKVSVAQMLAATTALPTAEINAPPPSLELQAITSLGRRVAAHAPFANDAFHLASFAYDSTCRDELDFGVFQEMWRAVNEGEGGGASWLNAANAVTRLSAGVHYFLHHRDRVYSLAVVAPWPRAAADPETMVALNWRGLGEFDVGFLPSCEAELLLVPSAAQLDGTFVWRLVNCTRLKRCLQRQMHELPTVHYIFGTGGRDLSHIPLLAKTAVRPEAIIARATAGTTSGSSKTASQIESPLAHHDAHADELLCGTHCRIAPPSELSAAQSATLLSQSANRVAARALATEATTKTLAHYFALATMTDPSGAIDNHDRSLLATLSSWDCFLRDHSLYCDDEVL